MLGEVVVSGGYFALWLLLAIAWFLGWCCGICCCGRTAHAALKRGSGDGLLTPPRRVSLGCWFVEELPSGERFSIRRRALLG